MSPPSKSPHPVKSLRGPLIIVAAAVVWCGSGAFYASHRMNGDDYARVGLWIAGLLFISGLMITFDGNQKDD